MGSGLLGEHGGVVVDSLQERVVERRQGGVRGRGRLHRAQLRRMVLVALLGGDVVQFVWVEGGRGLSYEGREVAAVAVDALQGWNMAQEVA